VIGVVIAVDVPDALEEDAVKAVGGGWCGAAPRQGGDPLGGEDAHGRVIAQKQGRPGTPKAMRPRSRMP